MSVEWAWLLKGAATSIGSAIIGWILYRIVKWKWLETSMVREHLRFRSLIHLRSASDAFVRSELRIAFILMEVLCVVGVVTGLVVIFVMGIK